MTFSNPRVAEAVNADFVPAWHNRSPGFRNTDDAAEKHIFEHSNEAFPTQNICTFILSPDGKVFHYVAGYLAPELFLEFLDDARLLRRSGFDDRMRLKPGGLDAMRALHAERAKRPLPKLDVVERAYRGARHRHTEACVWVARSLHEYKVRLHKHWSEAKGLPALEEVRYKYLYGNPFTEEGAGAAKIAQDPSLIRRG